MGSKQGDDSGLGKKILILDPGSLNCRVGVANADVFTSQDELPNPVRCLNVLARPTTKKTIPKITLDLSIEYSKDRNAAIENTKRKIGLPPARVQKSTITPRIECEKLPRKTEKTPRILFGIKAAAREHDDDYEVIWPFKEGRLNLSRLPGDQGRTPTAIQNDLSTLWTHMIETYCRIKAESFSEYRVMLLVPDQFLRKHIRIMVDALMLDMNFASVFVHQESVCTAFGAGLSTACVVDIGHEKTSITCIDDGISINRSRAYYNYGGKDIQELLCYLLCNSSSFSLDDGNGGKLSGNDLFGQTAISTIAESLCHLDMEDAPHKRFDIVVREPGNEKVRIYPLNLQQELILMPMAFFHIDMLRGVHPDHHFESNAEYNEAYDCLDPPTYVEMGGTLGRYAEKGPKDKVLSKGIDSNIRLSVDEAVITSIRQVGNPELYEKLLSNIVLTGGATMYPYFGKVLEEMVLSRVKSTPQLASCISVDVLALPRENDSCELAWKGAAIVATAPSVQDCWVTQQEWKEGGITKLREKVCFRW